MQDKFLTRFTREMREKYDCHTLILYGSRARGEASPVSDYDLLGFRKTGVVIHDARKIRGVYLDAFIYPEKGAKSPDLLRARSGKVIFQKNGFGDAFLARLKRVHARGPKPLGSDEIAVRKVWAKKMLDRAKQGDPEDNFRRIWLLNTLLEDYFALRGMWYEGPKAALKWLRQNEPKVNVLFERALKPGAKISQIEKLAAIVTAVPG